MKIPMKCPGLLLSAILTLLLAGCNDRETASDSTDSIRANATTRDANNATTTDADNTAKNVRDRDDATLTPGDQGTSPADREMTQKIRKVLTIDTTGYSTTAKNIKIITVNGKVTLRGPVKTEAEKMGIVTIAKSAAGEANVEDQLEVKANP